MIKSTKPRPAKTLTRAIAFGLLLTGALVIAPPKAR
jgi:hypothetical protein